jgi:hypothetical protein
MTRWCPWPGDYAVVMAGESIPPEATRFKPGTSGNYSGRPAGDGVVRTLILEAFRQSAPRPRNDPAPPRPAPADLGGLDCRGGAARRRRRAWRPAPVLGWSGLPVHLCPCGAARSCHVCCGLSGTGPARRPRTAIPPRRPTAAPGPARAVAEQARSRTGTLPSPHLSQHGVDFQRSRLGAEVMTNLCATVIMKTDMSDSTARLR